MPAMTKLNGRIVDENNEYIKKQLIITDSKGNTINLDNFKIGHIRFEGSYLIEIPESFLGV